MKKIMKANVEKGYVNRYDKLLGEIDRIRVKDDKEIANKSPKEIISYYIERVKAVQKSG